MNEYSKKLSFERKTLIDLLFIVIPISVFANVLVNLIFKRITDDHGLMICSMWIIGFTIVCLILRFCYLFQINWSENIIVDLITLDMRSGTVRFENEQRKPFLTLMEKALRALREQKPEFFERITPEDKDEFQYTVIDIFEYAIIYFISKKFFMGWNVIRQTRNSWMSRDLVENDFVQISFAELPDELKLKNRVFSVLASIYENKDHLVMPFFLPGGSNIKYTREVEPVGNRIITIENPQGEIQITLAPSYFSFFKRDEPFFSPKLTFSFKSNSEFGFFEKHQVFVGWVEKFFTDFKNQFAG